jgi:hypothetical protein
MIYGFISSNARTTMRRAGVSSGYTPSGANKFRWLAARYERQNGAANTGRVIYPGYADNDVGWDSPTLFTTPKYLGGDQAWGFSGGDTGNGLPSHVGEIAIDLLVLNAKFPFIQLSTGADGTTAVIGYGYEEA